jgi:hypothetical protein
MKPHTQQVSRQSDHWNLGSPSNMSYLLMRWCDVTKIRDIIVFEIKRVEFGISSVYVICDSCFLCHDVGAVRWSVKAEQREWWWWDHGDQAGLWHTLKCTHPPHPLAHDSLRSIHSAYLSFFGITTLQSDNTAYLPLKKSE